jgi:hypothetical protein
LGIWKHFFFWSIQIPKSSLTCCGLNQHPNLFLVQSSFTFIKPVPLWYTIVRPPIFGWKKTQNIIKHAHTHTRAQTFSDISEASRARVSSRSWCIQNRLVTLATESFWLVVYQPLWIIWKSVGMIIPNIWLKIKHVPNHQPAFIFSTC